MRLNELLQQMRAAETSADVDRIRGLVTKSLAQIAEDGYQPLDRSSLRYLHEQLDISRHHIWPVEKDIPFVVAILHALGRVGGKSSLLVVDPLTNSECAPIRDAAIQCAAAIRSRIPSSRHSRLLRPAQPTQLLLRQHSANDLLLQSVPDDDATSTLSNTLGSSFELSCSGSKPTS